MAYYCYLRGMGLEAQRAICEAYAPLAEVYSDEGAAISALSPGDILLVAKLDRLGRNADAVASLVEAIQKKGARLVILAE